jgi:hypothetical protein
LKAQADAATTIRRCLRDITITRHLHAQMAHH